ncbi:hypothetical protein Ana3638_20890 [Anaerocolumna sedimenticola]|uniref:Uncharacterized protein n=1 Tax=Anaerocolumna sedimenticola TaxID=2696063 RepID=A0A6P1TR26_9FIRM|nr:hypothetical protein [Anaerocolumna sedimenticola]QHQ62933.1 hypothetical protein Ana3638_20890 [Anaerocolumna sedimenticola]
MTYQQIIDKLKTRTRHKFKLKHGFQIEIYNSPFLFQCNVSRYKTLLFQILQDEPNTVLIHNTAYNDPNKISEQGLGYDMNKDIFETDDYALSLKIKLLLCDALARL